MLCFLYFNVFLLLYLMKLQLMSFYSLFMPFRMYLSAFICRRPVYMGFNLIMAIIYHRCIF